MIAPLRPPEPQRSWRIRRPSETLRKARRLVAETLLPRQRDALHGPPVPAWKSWLAVAWMCAVLGAFLLAWWRAR